MPFGSIRISVGGPDTNGFGNFPRLEVARIAGPSRHLQRSAETTALPARNLERAGDNLIGAAIAGVTTGFTEAENQRKQLLRTPDGSLVRPGTNRPRLARPDIENSHAAHWAACSARAIAALWTARRAFQIRSRYRTHCQAEARNECDRENKTCRLHFVLPSSSCVFCS